MLILKGLLNGEGSAIRESDPNQGKMEEIQMTTAVRKLQILHGGNPSTSTPTDFKLALVKTPKEQGEKVLLDIEALTPSVQSQVNKFYHELNVSLTDFGRSGLKVGKVLHEARGVLKPLGIWIAFLNRVPGLSAKTGDRFIKRFEMAGKQLSPTVMGIAVTTGIDMAGEDESQPYGKYSKAVKKVGNPPKDTGDEGKDTEKARVWLSRVLVVHANELKRKRAQLAEVDPTDKASDTLVKQIESYVEDREGQVSFLKRVLKRTLKRLGYGDLIVTEHSKARSRVA